MATKKTSKKKTKKRTAGPGVLTHAEAIVQTYEAGGKSVTKIILPPGAKTPMTHHPCDYIVIACTHGCMKLVDPEGNIEMVCLCPGLCYVRKGPCDHCVENPGDGTIIIFK